ncbi:Dirigent protein 25 [Striga hermonthica]|uniref:S-acyltransferase n=1 Tax=Striga hermonthica TaxID=68872 RepID=A0A9N7N5B1_STRHE|nr:Dirigent protein 25 [Striga hermonthica]
MASHHKLKGLLSFLSLFLFLFLLLSPASSTRILVDKEDTAAAAPSTTAPESGSSIDKEDVAAPSATVPGGGSSIDDGEDAPTPTAASAGGGDSSVDKEDAAATGGGSSIDGKDAATGPTSAAAGSSSIPEGGDGAHHPLTFFMHDVLGGSRPSAVAVTGIVANPTVGGQVPFAKPNGAVLPGRGVGPTNNNPNNNNINNNNNGIVNNNNIPFLTGLSGFTSSNVMQNNNNNNGIIGGVPGFPSLNGAQFQTGTTLQKLMFGTMTVFDDELTEGRDLESGLVGKAQGFYVASSEDGSSQTIAFTVMFASGSYADSLSLFGVHRTAVAESHLAIMGGTGKFVNAKGFATVKTFQGNGQHDTDGFLRKLMVENRKWDFSIVGCLVSFISVVCTQLTLSFLPLILPTSSLFTLLPLSALLLIIVVGLGRFCKRAAGVRASAPAFVVLSILFVWALYFSVIRQVISPFVDVVFNVEVIMVIVGLYRIMSLDPGYVTNNDISCHDLEELKISVPIVHRESLAQEVLTGQRSAKYCTHCKHYVMGFDHHCPAFGNCIGQKNHRFFIVLLVGFAASEASFAACASHFTAKFGTSSGVGWKGAVSRNFVLSTMLFCLVQVFWQINWKQYPEFQMKFDPSAGQTEISTQFINPYNRGILRNLKEFLTETGLDYFAICVNPSPIAFQPEFFQAALRLASVDRPVCGDLRAAAAAVASNKEAASATCER